MHHNKTRKVESLFLGLSNADGLLQKLSKATGKGVLCIYRTGQDFFSHVPGVVPRLLEKVGFHMVWFEFVHLPRQGGKEIQSMG
jgi:hypothetical protein